VKVEPSPEVEKEGPDTIPDLKTFDESMAVHRKLILKAEAREEREAWNKERDKEGVLISNGVNL